MSAERVNFAPLFRLDERVDRVVEELRIEIQRLLPDAEVEHIGATSIPGSITKGDVDLLVRVLPGGFDAAVRTLGESYEVHQRENWTSTFASFAGPPMRGLPVGLQLVAAGSLSDRQFTGLRDLLCERADLVERMNRLKRSHDGGDADTYWRAKQDLIEEILADAGLGDEPHAGA